MTTTTDRPTDGAVTAAGEAAAATTVATAPRLPSSAESPPTVDIVVPVYNEERDLEGSVRRLHAALSSGLPYTFRVTIADNASTDRTPAIADRLAAELPEVTAVHLPEKGRGRALKHTWLASDAAVLAYMDVDLSTDLAALLPLVAPLVTGHSDLAIGSRLARHSRVVRGPKREVISRCYNVLLRMALAAKFTDAQCGFKAIRADRARALLPHVQDAGWFFDTELLVLAERAGLRIHEVPVDWVDDPDSRVDVLDTAVQDLLGITRVARSLLTGQIPVAELRAELRRDPLPVPVTSFRTQAVRFATVGFASTLAYLLLYLVLRTGLPAEAANAVSLLVTAVSNTAVNRRFTFGVRDSSRRTSDHASGLVIFAAGLALTSAALAAVHLLDPDPHRAVELTALVAANLITTALRFVALRWVFTGRRRTTAAATVAAPIATPGDIS
ncbi:MAG: glycosyltransferase [Actinomycetes bacterium]